MILSTTSKKRTKPSAMDTRIVRKFIFLPVPNIFGDKLVWLEYRNVLQMYDDTDGILRWRNIFYVDNDQSKN